MTCIHTYTMSQIPGISDQEEPWKVILTFTILQIKRSKEGKRLVQIYIPRIWQKLNQVFHINNTHYMRLPTFGPGFKPLIAMLLDRKQP